MTHKECMESSSNDAKRVREILEKVGKVKFPDDLIMYQILKEDKK